ncbi:DUF2752 domain-containing protein [Pedobacter sp. KR3-3]|uniref:DUF2752 domain-containing protein n=1 Tax=Pedobacter albus TaxID=3113905 RepID=A0ABU7ID00_9SPHI|nr:DUF2752 domain-containing protein [Pedobacter sp. KR3-3]MEE1947156.1 DUF2752 domain-containing protein [Pedobacter sp. KR3-3]
MKNVVGLGLLLLLTEAGGFIHWLERHLLACPFKQTFGIDCPGCGLQRSVLALMKGDVVASFKLYPPTLPILFLVVFTILHLKFDFKNGAFLIKILYIGIALIIVVNYIYKILNHQLI